MEKNEGAKSKQTMASIVSVIILIFAIVAQGAGVGLLDASGSTDVDGYIKKYEWSKWNDDTQQLDHFCHISWSPDDPNNYYVYDKNGNLAGSNHRAALNVTLDIGIHYFALKVTDDNNLSSLIRMEKRTGLDTRDEWKTIEVIPNPDKNKPPLIFTEYQLAQRRDTTKALIYLWNKFKDHRVLAFFSKTL